MKKLLVFVLLPVVLFGLETVNLIKDAGFELDSEVWSMRSEADGEYDSTIIDRHDPDSSFNGNFSGSIDTRTSPSDGLPNLYDETGKLYQVMTVQKKLADLDTLELYHMAIFRQEGNILSTRNYGLRLEFSEPSDGSIIEAWYYWLAPDIDPASDSPTEKFFPDTIRDEGNRYTLKRDLYSDLVDTKALSNEIELDSLVLYGYGINSGTW